MQVNSGEIIDVPSNVPGEEEYTVCGFFVILILKGVEFWMSILDSFWLLSLLYLEEYSGNPLDKIYNVAISYLNEFIRNTS